MRQAEIEIAAKAAPAFIGWQMWDAARKYHFVRRGRALCRRPSRPKETALGAPRIPVKHEREKCRECLAKLAAERRRAIKRGVLK